MTSAPQSGWQAQINRNNRMVRNEEERRKKVIMRQERESNKLKLKRMQQLQKASQIKSLKAQARSRVQKLTTSYKKDPSGRKLPLSDQINLLKNQTYSYIERRGKIPGKLVNKQAKLQAKLDSTRYKFGKVIVPKPAHVVKAAATYTGGANVQKATKAINKGTRSIVKTLFMTPLTSSPQRGRGRPRGPSGKYRDPNGNPLYEAQFQEYRARQSALNRMSPSSTQSAPLTMEDIRRMQEGQTIQPEQQMSQQMPQEFDELDYYQEQEMMQQPSQMPQMPQRRPIYEDPEVRRMRQMIEQQNDNILKAPNFAKGELKATGGSILTPVGPNILDAPNFQKGEMRTLNKGNPQDFSEVKLGSRPQTNPSGDEYLEIEIGSGKPVLRKRPREKWMTGEAL